MVGWGLRSSEPCGCTLTLRDRFLWLSVLVRVGSRGRKVGAARERKGGGGGGYLGQVWKEDELVGECEELVHLQRKCTRKGRE